MICLKSFTVQRFTGRVNGTGELQASRFNATLDGGIRDGDIHLYVGRGSGTDSPSPLVINLLSSRYYD